jgi:hypothetical protein
MPRPCLAARRTAIIVVATSISLNVGRAAEPTTYLPDGTMLVASLNVRQFLDAPLIRENASARQAIGEVSKALQSAGVEAKDLDRVVFALGEQLRASSWLLLVQGRFEVDRVQNRLKERARERKNEIDMIEDAGVTVFQCRLPKPSTPSPRFVWPERFFLTVLDNSTIALALDRGGLNEALAKKSGRRKSELKPRLLELVGKIQPGESLSVVFIPPAELVAGGPVSGLVDVTGGITVGESIVTQVRLEARDAETTRALGEQTRDGLSKVRDILPGLAALQMGIGADAQAAIRDIVDSFKMTSSGTTVTVAGTITKEMLEKLGRK